jgi:hypothetical protein
MTTTNNELYYGDHQPPLGILHFCIGGKNLCVDIAT